jgi:hypothetical protein
MVLNAEFISFDLAYVSKTIWLLQNVVNNNINKLRIVIDDIDKLD